jgi:hypothetical protein
MSLLSTLIGRTADLEHVCEHAARGECCSVVGVSNLGKTALLRHLCDPTTEGHCDGTFIYVDCNQMPERTARAFFTTTWRVLAATLEARVQEPEVHTRVRCVNDEMADAHGMVDVGLNFDKGIAVALDHLDLPLVLCLDDFDEAYQNLELQTFLNLRSLKDRCGDVLAYVTATERELSRLTVSREQGEFYELIGPRVHFLHSMDTRDTREFCERFAMREGVTFSDADLAFVRENADGHPGLVQAVCYALGAVTGAPTRDAQQDRVIHQIVRQNLATDANVQSELVKIWGDLETDEREALLRLHHASVESSTSDSARGGLQNKFIVRDSDEGPVIFSRLFDDFVRQQILKQQPNARGIYIDVDAGDVWVDGKPLVGANGHSPLLTDLEYRLLLFLYGRLDRVCDKYAIVESVWGEEYIDQVDDARIEKLVSRVRQKIEPDAAHPRYLVSVRGRGYKLVR